MRNLNFLKLLKSSMLWRDLEITFLWYFHCSDLNITSSVFQLEFSMALYLVVLIISESVALVAHCSQSFRVFSIGVHV